MSPEIVSESGRLFGWGIVGAVTLELFGVPVQPIIFGLMGGALGQTVAKPDYTQWRRFAVYVVVAVVSGAGGDAVATHMGWTPKIANLLSLGLAMFFQPISANLATRVPEGINWVFGLFGRRGQ